MTHNMGTFDRTVRAFVVAPAAIVVALILGAGTLGGVILFVVAGIMLIEPSRRSARPTRRRISTDPRLRRVGHRLSGGHA